MLNSTSFSSPKREPQSTNKARGLLQEYLLFRATKTTHLHQDTKLDDLTSLLHSEDDFLVIHQKQSMAYTK